MRTGTLVALSVATLTACGPAPEEGRSEAAANGSQSNETPTLTGELVPGELAVGFRKERLELASDGETPSALVLYLWYPAAGATSRTAPLTLADYYAIQEDAPPSQAELRAWLLDDMTDPPGLEPDDLRPDRPRGVGRRGAGGHGRGRTARAAPRRPGRPVTGAAARG